MAVHTAHSSPAVAQPSYVTGAVISKDGTTIGYRQLGQGPALIILHGSMESAESHMQLAEALADTYTVYLPDRRGRGLSGPYSQPYSVQNDIEDMDALLNKTGAHLVMGVSSGAIIWLHAALTLPAIQKMVIFEPPFALDDASISAFVPRYDAAIANGQIVDALVTAMLGSHMGPPAFERLPRWFLKGMTRLMMMIEAKTSQPDSITMRKLAPTLHYDFQLVVDSQGSLEKFKGISAEVLLLGGEVSPAYLKKSMNALAQVFPHAQRIEFPKLGHGATGNTNRGGKPELAAQALRQFFDPNS